MVVVYGVGVRVDDQCQRSSLLFYHNLTSRKNLLCNVANPIIIIFRDRNIFDSLNRSLKEFYAFILTSLYYYYLLSLHFLKFNSKTTNAADTHRGMFFFFFFSLSSLFHRRSMIANQCKK